MSPETRKKPGCLLLMLGLAHGMLLAVIAMMALMSSHEDGLYDQIVENTVSTPMDDQEKVLALLHRTHDLLQPRGLIFSGEEYLNPRDRLLRSSDLHLIDAKGGCGSYTHVLGRLLQRAGYDIRIAQMKCGSTWGCHILLEVNIDGSWAALDALYDLAFYKDDGSLASFQEVKESWDSYRRQVPDNYDPAYSYEDVRYTNWSKIPVVLPAIKSVLNHLLGDKADFVSIRATVLNVYKAYLVILLTLYAVLLAITLVVMSRKSGNR